jgi:hypothetical protein
MQEPVAGQTLLQKIMTITFPFLMITTQTEKEAIDEVKTTY